MHLFKGLSIFAILGIASISFGQNDAVPLFQPAASNGTRSAGLVINQQAVSQLRSDIPSVSLGAVPLVTGESANFRLTPMPIFAKDATIQVVKDDGTTETVAPPDVRTWYGEDLENPDRALFVAASPDGEVRGMITGDVQTSVTVISRDISAGSETYRLERNVIPARDFCNTTELSPELRESLQQKADAAIATRAGRNNVTYDIELMIDVGNVLYTKFNLDASATLDYITELFGAVNVIYMRDLNVHFSVMHTTLWEKPDPFSAQPAIGSISTMSQLAQYRNYITTYRNNVPYDLAHFLDGIPLGGRAYLDIMQIYRRDVRSGVSNVDAIGAFPTDGSWYWDTNVVAHELGHNLGSPHSHCYKPPIDCCEDECIECGIEKPSMGTIMSYCHLQMGNGGGINMRFHERCVALMRHRVESSLILAPYIPQPDIEIRGGEGTLVPANALDTVRSTLFRSSAIGSAVSNLFEFGIPAEKILS